jgi:PAS domain S-box-containing protein
MARRSNKKLHPIGSAGHSASWKEFLEASPACIKVFDRNGMLAWINAEGRREHFLEGLSEAETLRWKYMESIEKEYRPGVERALYDALEGKITTLELKHVKGTSTGTYCLSTLAPVRDENGDVGHVIFISTHIDDLKRTEQRLTESEKRFKGIFDFSRDGILIADAESRKFVMSNEAIRKMMGYTEDEMKRLGVENIHPKKNLPDAMAKFTKMVRGELDLASDLPVVRKDGSVFYADITAFRLSLGERDYLVGTFRDITERKQAETILRLASLIIDQSSDAIFSKSLDGTITSWNPAAERMYGYSAKEAIGKQVRMLLPADRKGEMTGILARIKRGKTISNYDTVRLKKNGDLIQVALSVSPIKDSEGNIVGASTIARDITGTKKMEKAIADSEVKYRTLIENATDQIFMLDRGIRYISLNSASARQFGKTTNEMIGKPVSDFVPERIAVQFSRNIKEVLRTGKGKSLEERAELGGRVVYLSTSLNPVKDAKRNVVAVIGVVRDITERKQMDNELQDKTAILEAQVNATIDGVLIVDKNGKKIVQNQRCIDLWRIPKHIVANNDDSQQIEFVKNRAKDPKKFVEKVVYLYSHPDEVSRDEVEFKDGMVLDRYSAPVILRDGTNSGRIWLFRDITEKKKAEELLKNYSIKLESEVRSRTLELEKEKKKLEVMSELKDEFIRNVTHELKTPLSVVLANLSLLRDYSPLGREKDWTKLLDMMERNSERLNHSVNQILSFSKLDEITVKHDRVYLNEVIDSVYKDYLPLAAAKNLEMKVDIEPVIIMGDREMLAIAIGNFVSNSVKFTERGTVNLVLRGKRDSATITVRDTGIGIAKKELKRIFDPFFKSNPSAPGTGIGLTVAKEIIDKHGGKISVESRPGKGSLFEITLPRGI